MNIKYLPSILITLLFTVLSFGQNTVGLISVDLEETAGGYSLIYPEFQPNVYLINACGELVHQWEDDPQNEPGKTAYLLENGNLWRAKNNDFVMDGTPNAGGAGGIIELLTWDNELLWSDTIADENIRQHHDIYPMENGNIMIIVWDRKGFDEIVENGFDTLNYTQTEIWPDFIREINPSTNEIVWEWHAWDHIIQDFDESKLNYGDVGAHPELIDLNYQKYTANKFDWLHSNSIDYDPIRDHILLSVRHFNEIWVIDHSTTTEEAAGHTGGNSGMGGDLLYRWGNPEAYRQGTEEDRQLFFQHDAQWIDDFVDTDYEHFGKIVLYNNQVEEGLSFGHILEPIWNDTTQSFEKLNELFLPQSFTQTISHPDTAKNHSIVASSIQVIGDGHIIMCAARQGFSFELSDAGDAVWEYRTPMINGFPAIQGTDLAIGQNFTFQIERYPEDFEGFVGRDLSPKGHIELEPNLDVCTLTSIEEVVEKSDIKLFPNPANDFINFSNPFNGITNWRIVDQFGRPRMSFSTSESLVQIDVSSFSNGLYFLYEDKSGRSTKFIVSK